MSHEILGERFISRTETAWHKLGKTFEDDLEISASEAVGRVAGDIRLVTAPIAIDLESKVPGAGKILTGEKAVVRLALPDDQQIRVFGHAGEEWNTTPYEKMAELLDPLSLEQYKVETCGVIYHGKKVFLALRGEDWSVKGDEMHTYHVVTFSGEPGVGDNWMHTPVRVVCRNTLMFGQQLADLQLVIPHNQQREVNVKLAADIATKMIQAQKETSEIFEQLASKEVSQDDANAIFEAAFPAPPMPKRLRMVKNTFGEIEAYIAQADEEVSTALTRSLHNWQRDVESTKKRTEQCAATWENFQPEPLRRTVWGAYNAATEVSDWRPSRGEGEAAALDSLYGRRASEKCRALDAAMAVAGIERD